MESMDKWYIYLHVFVDFYGKCRYCKYTIHGSYGVGWFVYGFYHGSNYNFRFSFKYFFPTTEQANLTIWLHLCHMSYLSSIAKCLPLVKNPSGKCFTALVPWKSVSNNVWCVCIPFIFNFTEIHALYIYTTFLFPPNLFDQHARLFCWKNLHCWTMPR